MNTLKKAIVISACLLIAGQLIGCSNKKQNVENIRYEKGGYEEHIIESSISTSNISKLMYNGDKMLFVDNYDFSVYSIDENNKFVSENNNALTSQDIIPVRVLAVKGDTFFIEGFETSSNDQGYYIIDNAGKKTKIQTNEFIYSAGYDKDDDKIIIISNGAISEINLINYSVKQIADVGQRVYAMDVIGNKAYVVDETGVHIIDCSSGSELESNNALNEFFSDINYEFDPMNYPYDIYGADDNSIYILCTDGIYRYAENGNQVEQLIDGKKYSIGSAVKTPISLVINGDGNISVLFDNAEIAEYEYDPEMSNTIDSVLKVYSLYKDNGFSQNVNQYLINNKNVQIDYNIGYKEGGTIGDAIEDLTLQVLSGESPDLILLDGIDIDNFKDKNILVDLSNHESEWKPEGEYLNNIVEWNRDNKGLFCVASRFRLPAFGGNKGDIDKITSFSDLADKAEKIRKEGNPSYQIMGFGDSDSVAKLKFIYDGMDILNNEHLNADDFIKFYTDCSKVFKNDLSSDLSMSFSDTFSNSSDTYNFIGRYYNSVINKDSFAVGTINSIDNELDFITSANTGKNEYDVSYKYGIGNGKKTFVPSYNIGVVDSGKNHQEAFKFIKFILESDNQKAKCSEGLPVNCEALSYFYGRVNDSNADQQEYDVNLFSSSSYEPGGITDDITVKFVNKKNSSEFDEYIRTLDEPVYIDSITMDIINSSLRKILFEDASIDQMADDTVRQLELKMKE